MILYTDGSCAPNPGTGGWAVIKDGILTSHGRNTSTTVNRMELEGFIAALEVANGEQATIYTDSTYVQGGFEKIERWYSTPRRAAKVKNPDLWNKVVALKKDMHPDTKVLWVRGHSGDEGNETADYFAKLAMEGAI